VVHAGPDITMHRLSLGMRVKELPTICIGMMAILVGPATRPIVTFIGHIILSSEELQGTQTPKVEIFPTKWGFGIVNVQVGLWSSNPLDPTSRCWASEKISDMMVGKCQRL